MSRSVRSDFERWLRGNGAEMLGPKQNEFARFRAQGILCIVYETNRKGRQSCTPDLAREAFDAWCAQKPLDLSNKPEVEAEDRRAVYAALRALADRVKAGEDIDVDAEATTIGIPPRRLVTSFGAQGAVIPEFA